MPELPEVETVKRYLERNVINRQILSCEILWKNVIKKTETEMNQFLNGETILRFERFGKYLVFVLSNNKAIISHFRMEGRFYIMKDDEDNSPYPSVIFHLDHGLKLIYDDSRRFGVMDIRNHSEVKNYPGIKKLAPEPWDISEETLYKNLIKSNTQIKKALLNQEVVAGLGNIYVDEVNFVCGIHPKTMTRSVPKGKIKEMKKHMQLILEDAISQNGTQVKSFVGDRDLPPHFQNTLKCYGRVGLPCVTCGRPLKKTFIGGRGTTYCSSCQKNYNQPLLIAITGPVLSGKSLVTSFFNEFGYKSVNADTIVALSYQEDAVKQKISGVLPINASEVTKEKVRIILKDQPALFAPVEKILFENVEKEIKKFRAENTDQPILIVEAPTLFNAEMENLFDYIIGVNVSRITQSKRSVSRANLDEETIDLFNKNNQYFKNLKSVDFMINNDEKDKKDLKNEVRELIKSLL